MEAAVEETKSFSVPAYQADLLIFRGEPNPEISTALQASGDVAEHERAQCQHKLLIVQRISPEQRSLLASHLIL